MENYDSLSLFKYTTKTQDCSYCDAYISDDNQTENIQEQESENAYSQPIGDFELPECVLINTRDGATLGNKEVDAYGTLTDEDIAQGLAAGEESDGATTTKNLFDLTKFKNLGKTLVSKIKKLIFNLHNPNNPVNPNTPGGDDPDVPGGDDPDNPGGDVTPPPSPSSDGTDGTGPKPEDKKANEDLVLSRGDAAKSIKVSSTEKVVTLKNPFGGSDYQYTVTSTNGAEVNVQFEFLKNGRLVITGDNIKVVANNNQKDDIILLAHNSELDTGDGDDIIRVGYVKDSSPYKMSSSTSGYTLTSNGITYRATVNNKINSGSGNDYISMFGEGFTIDAGADTDYVQLMGDTSVSRVSGGETIHQFHSKTSNIDGYDGWVLQGNEGDCRLLAFFNSLCGNQNVGKLSDYVTIQKQGLGYTVSFINYPGAKKSISVTQSDVNSYNGVYGDLDSVIADMALNKLIAQNKDRGQNSVERAHYNTLSNYMLGTEKVTYISGQKDGSNFESRLVELWNKYKDGEISNFEIGIHVPNAKLGIINGHAYSVKNMYPNQYVEVVNPWDDADVLRLDWATFMSLNLEGIVYGYDVFNENKLVPNGGQITTLSSNNEEIDTGLSLFAQKTSEGLEMQVVNEIKEIEDNVNNIKNLIYDANKKNIELLS